MRGSILILTLAAVLPLVVAPACGATQRPDGGSGPLAVGATVPGLEAPDHRGETVSLPALAGQPVLIYFYPKDGTPGCTKEACAIRDTWERFEEAGIVVLGVSGDDAESHRAFAEEHDLPFPLIPDPDLTWANAFGVSHVAGITARTSFLVGRDGKIAKVYADVDPAQHASEVLADAAALASP